MFYITITLFLALLKYIHIKVQALQGMISPHSNTHSLPPSPPPLQLRFPNFVLIIYVIISPYTRMDCTFVSSNIYWGFSHDTISTIDDLTFCKSLQWIVEIV